MKKFLLVATQYSGLAFLSSGLGLTISFARIIPLIAALSFSLASPLTQAYEGDQFILSGLRQLKQKYPWLEPNYPFFQEDLRQALTQNTVFLTQLKKLQGPYSGTVELQVQGYLDNTLLEHLVIAGVSMSVAVLTGGISGSFSTFASNKETKFELTFGEKKYHSNVSRSSDKLVEMPKSGEKNAQVRDNVYQHMKDFFVKDAIHALQLMDTRGS